MFDKRSLEGAYFALAAYIFWGVAPIYFKWVSHLPPLEVVAHRVVWSVIPLLAVITLTQSWPSLKVSKTSLLKLGITSSILSVNWLIYIWAIAHNNIAETSLGYFINPLVSVFLGMVFLGESLRPLQWIAIAITAAGIAYQLFFYGAVPWIALCLAFSFGFYGLIRKNLNLPSATGLSIETFLISPLALIYLFWVSKMGAASFGNMDARTDLLLIGSGLVTIFPLLCFTAAVTRLSLTAAGMFQYLAPSISLIIAVGVYNEPFGTDRLITFSCIWTALIIFVVESLLHQQKLAYKMRIPI